MRAHYDLDSFGDARENGFLFRTEFGRISADWELVARLGAPMMSAEWMFALVSACQVLICDTIDARWSEIPAIVTAFAASIPEPPSPAAALVLQSTVLDLAMRWAYARHGHVRNHCRENRCLSPLLAILGSSWAGRNAPPLVLFEQWVAQYCDTIAPTHPDPVASAAALWIRRHANEPLDVTGLARRFNVDVWRLRREFRERIGMSLREWHTRARVADVAALAGRTDAKAEWIALMAGWRSKKSMYRAVRRIHGCTPGSLRRRRTLGH